MADPGFVPAPPGGGWVPVPRGAVASPRSPQALVDYVVQRVPGVSAGAAAWLLAQFAAGRNVLGDPLRAQLNGLTLGQLNQIGGLLPFMGGAPVNQGPAHPAGGGAVAPGEGGVANWPPVPPPPVQPPSDVSGLPPRPIHQPPAEDFTVPQNTPGFPNYPGQPAYVAPPLVTGHHPADEGYYPTGPGPFGGSGVDYTGGAHGTGAQIAEHYLGAPAPGTYLDPVDHPSPVKYLGRRKPVVY